MNFWSSDMHSSLSSQYLSSPTVMPYRSKTEDQEYCNFQAEKHGLNFSEDLILDHP